MVDKNNLNRRVDDLLEKLRYLEMVIRNLKERNGTLITNVGNIDERLFRELANYEMSTEELKKDFVLLLLQDAKRLEAECIKNINTFNKTSEEFNKIEEILDFIRNHETQDIEKSRELQKFAEKAKIRLDNIKKEMTEKVREKKKEKEEYERTQAMHRQLK